MDIKYVNTVEFAFFHTGSKHALQVFPVVSKKLWQGRGRGGEGTFTPHLPLPSLFFSP